MFARLVYRVGEDGLRFTSAASSSGGRKLDFELSGYLREVLSKPGVQTSTQISQALVQRSVCGAPVTTLLLARSSDYRGWYNNACVGVSRLHTRIRSEGLFVSAVFLAEDADSVSEGNRDALEAAWGDASAVPWRPAAAGGCCRRHGGLTDRVACQCEPPPLSIERSSTWHC